MNIANRHITLSTVGLANAIRDLSKRNDPIFQLAVSLNASNDRIRSKMMPINRKFPMHTLKAALMEYPLKRTEVLFIEYVLIKNVNDGQEHARQLSEFLHPLKAKVNLIPLNTAPDSPFSAPSDSDTDRFCERLRNQGLVVVKRARKGHSIMAACGQLGGMRC
jgi:23S rRNA (adenine2503-C2)-methyltransferase